MNNLYNISWGEFFTIEIVLLVLGFVGTKVLWGRLKVRQVFRCSTEQWITILAVLSLLAFVLIHPVSHGIIVMIGGLVYYLISDNPLLKKEDFIGSKKVGKTNTDKSLRFTCLTTETQDLVGDRHRLRKCLFGAPYINHNNNLNIKQNGDAIDVSLTLQSDQYTSSLIQYLEGAGFNITIKTNNN